MSEFLTLPGRVYDNPAIGGMGKLLVEAQVSYADERLMQTAARNVAIRRAAIYDQLEGMVPERVLDRLPDEEDETQIIKQANKLLDAPKRGVLCLQARVISDIYEWPYDVIAMGKVKLIGQEEDEDGGQVAVHGFYTLPPYQDKHVAATLIKYGLDHIPPESRDRRVTTEDYTEINQAELRGRTVEETIMGYGFEHNDSREGDALLDTIPARAYVYLGPKVPVLDERLVEGHAPFLNSDRWQEVS